MSSFKRGVAEFYFDALELTDKDPQWAKDVVELAEDIKKKREEFKPSSVSGCNQDEFCITLEPSKSVDYRK